MSKHNPDPIYVRASVWPKCNLRCTYCPIDEGMENRVPERIAGQRLTTEQYVRNLRLIASQGISGVSYTGGEPTLRPDLDELIRHTRPYFERLELTTNGHRLEKFYDAVSQNVDLMKVSLDSVTPDRVLTLTKRRHAFPDAQRAINWALEAEIPLAVNVVLMRDTVPELQSIIDHCVRLKSRTRAPFHLSLLDFYYSPTRREEWLRGFVPTSKILGMLTERYGPPAVHTRFGCRFYWYEIDGLSVRLKDSYSATMRAAKCATCVSYCQEGIYGVKHSCEGWLTTCPSDREDLGVHLAADEADDEIRRRIRHVLSDVHSATADPKSFITLQSVHGLRLAPGFGGPPAEELAEEDERTALSRLTRT
jgi:molybdenum cofactor biosynthesis enzyme MoaA